MCIRDSSDSDYRRTIDKNTVWIQQPVQCTCECFLYDIPCVQLSVLRFVLKLLNLISIQNLYNFGSKFWKSKEVSQCNLNFDSKFERVNGLVHAIYILAQIFKK